ncbi:hypothetical protein Q9Q95_17540 [Sphingomonas sp. DG1-23]|jgi:hypothetical protein|uniref:hypothetical protein n=1 Tax=Sphingomonas sp. DG1-23 TaxID=3068316 RepID=UPI00273F82C1|nr:hypothetical protein [Sphingomonas sp. DG1-23]MDP5280733.1 hypothetical protein [Sphingomonas sp. DG1-23]
MRREFIAKLALGCAGIGLCGSLAGVGLANYAASGSFEFYKQRTASAWEPELPAQPTMLQSADLAFASDRRDGAESLAAEEALASFDR